ncbi:MAG: class I SAM-dependent methyltransferase [Myxococcota bacterium]
MSAASGDRRFEATDLIEVMDEAVHYNRFIVDLLLAWSRGLERVLDFGAGNGRYCGELHDRGVAVEAMEPDRELRARIRERGVAAHGSLDAVGSGSLDGIYTVNVLEHIEDDAGVLAAFHARLRPGGRLLVYVPAFQVLFTANDRRVGHVRRYRRGGLVRLVEAAGFTVDDARYVDSLGFAATLVYRFLGNTDGGLDVGAVRFYDRVVFPISRILDRLLGRVLGKNLVLRATRPPGPG